MTWIRQVVTPEYQNQMTDPFFSLSTETALPWWWETFKALPLAVQAFWMFTMGLIDRLMDAM